MQKDIRRHDRLLVNSKIEMIWLNDRGETCFARCVCTDISVSGMRLESPEPVPVRAFVNFQIDKLQFRGSGSVRSCVHKGLKFILGVEFGGGLTGDKILKHAADHEERRLASAV